MTRESGGLPAFHTVKERIRHENSEAHRLNLIIEQDQAIQNYFTDIKNKVRNEGILSKSTHNHTLTAARTFLEYIGFQITNHAINDLVQHKKHNPQDTQIETALRAFANEDNNTMHLRSQRRKGENILGIFRANFARLDLRIDNHFDSPDETCTEGIFQEIYKHLTPYQQAMIQWQQYAPERANAIYKVALPNIDLSRHDYALIHIEKRNSKVRYKHIELIPIDFAKPIVERATASRRKTPFPDHASQWKKITAFAKREYNVKLTSQYLRKRFHGIAERTAMTENLWISLIGERPKKGHLPDVYSPKFIDDLAQEYALYLQERLTLSTHNQQAQQTQQPTIGQLQAEITRLKQALAQILSTK